jgi:general secretion pathway protein L
LRNIELPFQDKKNIEQTLFFELEDLLITPVDEQIIEYLITNRTAGSSHLLIAGIEKKKLGNCLEDLKSAGYVPDTVTLRILAYAKQIHETIKTTDDFLVLDAELHSLTLAICHQGEIVLIRKLSYPDQMVVDSPFYFENSSLIVRDFQGATNCLTEICSKVKHSINYFNLQSGLHIQVDKIFITGCLSQSDFYRNIIAREYQAEIIHVDLQKLADVSLTAGSSGQYLATVYDHALALALSGFRKKQPINFLKEEFAGKGFLLQSKRYAAVTALLVFLMLGFLTGYYLNESSKLQGKYDQYTAEMNTLFKATFPETTRIVDPLNQMRVNFREVQKNTNSAPIITGEKRVLDILADISSRIPDTLSIHITQLTVDKETVRLKGTTDTFNNVNAIQKFLRNSPKYEEVDIVSATADKEKSKIRFEIRLKNREML